VGTEAYRDKEAARWAREVRAFVAKIEHSDLDVADESDENSIVFTERILEASQLTDGDVDEMWRTFDPVDLNDDSLERIATGAAEVLRSAAARADQSADGSKLVTRSGEADLRTRLRDPRDLFD
jgi:hypothetical protein